MATKSGFTALHFASELDRYDSVEAMIRNPAIDLNAVNNEGNTPLLSAMERHLDRIVKLLARNMKVKIIK